MPFDPTKPANNAPNSSAEMRDQLNGLKGLIDAILTLTNAQVDGVNTVGPGNSANASVNVSGNTLHFTFDIPQGANGADGINGSSGSDGAQGPPGPEGPQGPMGEISNMDLQNAIAGTSSNSNTVATLGMGVSDPPTQGEVQQIANKLDELINALRR
jgi:hypothetical protein